MIEKVESHIRLARDGTGVDLSIDEEKIRVGHSSPRRPSKQSEQSGLRSKQKKPAFADNYDFGQYENRDVDSDFAEQEVFSAIDIADYQ